MSEALHLTALVCVTGLSVNFWRPAAQLVQYWLAFDPLIVGAVIFWLVFLTSYLVLRALVRRITAMLGWERLHWVVQVVSLTLGAVRAMWWVALLLVTLSSSGVAYLQESVRERALLGARLVQPAEDLLGRATELFPGAQFRGDPLLPVWRTSQPKPHAG